MSPLPTPPWPPPPPRCHHHTAVCPWAVRIQRVLWLVLVSSLIHSPLFLPSATLSKYSTRSALMQKKHVLSDLFREELKKKANHIYESELKVLFRDVTVWYVKPKVSTWP